jgi:uncharacterized membrane protein
MFNRVARREKILLYSMAAFYVIAGIYHFVNSLFYKKIMPPWLPGHYTLIYTSGVIEIVLGLLLIPGKTRVVAAWCIIVLLIAVFPANIQMMLNYREEQHPYLWVAILRLPLQLLLVAWAYHFTKNKRN